MAQRIKNEETELKVPETMTFCTNNCGVTGNPSTNNMCQNCFNATTITSSSDTVSATSQSLTSTSRPLNKVVNRCSGCKRRVGLTGFRCRCGELFCTDHRYSDRHDCGYDHKTVGREAIARENPVVKAAKIIKV